jgi:signal transduction histidine kinase
MNYYLPTIRSSKNGLDRLADLAAETNDLFNSRLEIDFTRCGFFDANMAASLAAILSRIAADRFNRIEIVEVPSAIKTILCKNRFLASYGYNVIEDVNQTTLPYVRMQLSDEGLFAAYLNEHLSRKGIPRMSQAMGKKFRQSVFEIYQNVVIHSESNLGLFVCGQFYPQLQRLDLTIADAGIGIRTTVRRYAESKISSVEAIRWALEEGHTTKRRGHPGGVGLKFLKDFIELNGGKIQIASRYGFYEFNNDSETFLKLAADFPGTVVNLEVNTSDTKAYKLKSEISPDDIF